MIMVLSCCDLLAVIANHILMALVTMFLLTGKLETTSSWFYTSSALSTMTLAFSLFALLVLTFDRYLAILYPLFHRTSVTKGRLLFVFAILVLVEITLAIISLNNVVISMQVGVSIVFFILIPPMAFINFNLLRIIIVRGRAYNDGSSPEMKKILKSISSCLLAVASFVVLTIPVFVYLGLKLTSASNMTKSLNSSGDIAGLWAKTIVSINSTLNCLIFYWKNQILRREGLKVVGLKQGWMVSFWITWIIKVVLTFVS